MFKILGFLATPLGYLLRWICSLVPSYFVAIFVFTLIVRIVMFPLSIKTQKGQADRARLAPRLERIQKKYANDRQKLQQKQQELYEKEGVSLTGGCLPSLVQMLVLFSVIAVIYKPLTYVQRMDAKDLNSCVTAVTENLTTDDMTEKELKTLTSRFTENSYYRELYLMKYTDRFGEEMTAQLVKDGKSEDEARQVLTTLNNTKDEFSIFGLSLLEMPNETGLKPNWLWLIAILSGLATFASTFLSMRYSKAAMPADQQQMGGCSTNAMTYTMPIFSLIISFSVPGGVVVYWVFSNLLAMVQTVILNKMYNPAKIRAQAEIEYAERRRKKAEDKERLKQARLAEQAAWQREENEKKAGSGKQKSSKPAENPAPAENQPDEGKEETEE